MLSEDVRHLYSIELSKLWCANSVTRQSYLDNICMNADHLSNKYSALVDGAFYIRIRFWQLGCVICVCVFVLIVYVQTAKYKQCAIGNVPQNALQSSSEPRRWMSSPISVFAHFVKVVKWYRHSSLCCDSRHPCLARDPNKSNGRD